MKKFFRFIIKQSVAIVLIVVFVLAFGIYSTINMPINLLPDINVPMVCVQVIYAGANAQSVEKDVTVKLEDGLSAIGGVTDVDSYSYDNLSAVVLSFDYGTDTTEKKADIQSKLSSIDLPDGVDTKVYDIDLNAEALAVLSVTSVEEDEAARIENAYAAAEALSSRISAIDGVERVEIKGGPEKSFVIEPFAGLELLAPLFVQAFSYGALDIPLGNVTESGGSVQIRNNSDVTSVEDILDMPISLPSSIVTLLTSVKQLMNYYEDATAESLEDLKADLDGGVLTVLRDIDGMTYEELNTLAEFKTYINVAENFTNENLSEFERSRFYKEIYEAATNPPAEEGGERTPKSDEELEELLDDLTAQYPLVSQYLTKDMLRVISNGKLKDIIAFRAVLEEEQGYKDSVDAGEYYEFTPENYVMLARMTGVYGEDVSDETVAERAEFLKQTSATGLSEIADKKRESKDGVYVPTDSECAILFAGTELSAEHRIILSPTFMGFIRNENYEYNMSVLTENRRNFGEELAPAQYYKVYGELKLGGVFDYVLSEELIGFIQDTDFTSLTGGKLVTTVGEIATVEQSDGYSSYVYFGDGGVQIIKGVTIEVYKSNGANSSAVVREVKSIFGEFLSENGETYALGADGVRLLDDQSEFISDSISNVLVSMLIGGVLAVLVIFVFLKKVRTSLIIAITMPLSVLAALICLSLLGITLNMVSLGGLAVGIGMLVDNSIVVIESITKHRELDKSAFEAAVDGTTEVGGALFGSTVTTVCVFIPIIFSGGLTGEIFTDLSWAVIFSLTFSLIVAVSVIPALYAMFNGKKRMLKGGRFKKEEINCAAETSQKVEEIADCPPNMPEITPKKSFKQKLAVLWQSKVMDSVSSVYGKVLPKVLGKRALTIILAVCVFGASIGLLFLTGTEFLPSIDKGRIEVNMTYGSGADLEDIQSDVFAFAQAVQTEIDNVDYVSVSVGKNGLLALTDTGIITVALTTNRGTNRVVEKIRGLAESEEFKPTGTVTVKEIDGVVASLMSGTDDLSVTIVGDDGEILSEIAQKIQAKLSEEGFKDVKNSATDSAVEYDLRFDRKKMEELGLDYQTLVLTLRIGLASHTACTVTIDGSEYNLNVQFKGGAVEGVDGLKNFVVGADGDGKAVKLSEIAEITRTETAACIRRTGGKEMISVSATLPGTDTGSASKRMQKIAAEILGEYEGYSFQSSGISSYLTDAFQGLAVALVISFFLLYAVMAVQFGSALKPLIIMASIPFSFTGGFVALVITGTSLNVVSFIGLIMLMGVVVNNAIVMLEKIKQLHDEGMEHFTAVQEACKTRLRPIFMTTLTTVLALIPLAIGVGQGSELMQPLGIVVIGGLLLGTLVTLLLVPAVYCAVMRVSKKSEEDKTVISTE